MDLENSWQIYSDKFFNESKTVVVKIGSALLIDDSIGDINKSWLSCLAEDISNLKDKGKKVIIVSSGAVALGKKIFHSDSEKLDLEQSQAAAAVGQIKLCQAYQEHFDPLGIKTAQILVTSEDSQNRRRYLNSKATITRLLELNVVPIVNENDTVATDEIRFGDNDRLAAQVASLVGAEILVLLSDIDGIYSADPKLEKMSRHIPIVDEVNEAIVSLAGETFSNIAKGGMRTKVEAAQIASLAGCATVIAKGDLSYPISGIVNGGKVSWFLASRNPENARKQWINSIKIKGSVFIDEGAKKAIESGSSLLPAGITKFFGRFARGDIVEIINTDGKKVGKGISSYNSEELEKIKGCSREKISIKLGHVARSAFIHRDDMVL